MEYQQIMPGSFFGGRVLPPFEIFMNFRRIYFGQDYVKRPTKTSHNEIEESEE